MPKYLALGVPEVWFWQDGTLRLYHLREDGYEEVNQSKLSGLETLDIDLLKRCILIGETNLAEAVKVFQQGISTICELNKTVVRSALTKCNAPLIVY